MTLKLFGTDGIRGLVGTEPLTLSSLTRLAHAISKWTINSYGQWPRILIAHDTRLSASWLKATLQSGLLLSPVCVYDAGVLPTPAVNKLLQIDNQFHFGIVISASHNPFYDNGIKLITQHGKLTDAEEDAIISLIKEIHHPPHTHYGSHYNYGKGALLYRRALCSLFPNNFLKDTTIVIDCAQGATHHIAPLIFSHLGARVITLNNTPNGTNINQACGSLFPQMLQKVVIDTQAYAGFGFDGDGDRVIAINKNGEIKDGDHLLALLMHDPVYEKEPALVGTIMSNSALDHYAAQHGKKLVRTAVGDRNVHQALLEYGVHLGGEPAGHIIVRDYLDSSDGIFAALKVLHTMKLRHNHTMETFTAYPQAHYNLPVSNKRNLSDSDIAGLINKYESQLTAGRLIVRYSGTESLLRITAEDANYIHAQEIVRALAHDLKNQCLL